MNKVKFYRKKHGITQKELGEIIDVTTDYISQIERGRTPGIKTAKKISKIFNKKIDDIFFQEQQNS